MSGPRTRVSFEWDYGYDLPIRGLRDPRARLSRGLVRDMRRWLDAFEAANPSDDEALDDGWVDEGRRLSERVQKELGPSVEVQFYLDRWDRR